MPSKNCDFSKNYKKLEKSEFLLKLTSQEIEEAEGCPAKTAILQFLRFLQKLRKIGDIAVFAKNTKFKW